MNENICICDKPERLPNGHCGNCDELVIVQEIDYKELLIKYISHVFCEEGNTLVGRVNDAFAAVRFTDEEEKELRDIDKKLYK